MGNYVFDCEVLVDSLRADAADEGSQHSVGADIMPMLVRQGAAHVYDFLQNEVPGTGGQDHGYWREVGTLDSYFAAHMDLCAPDPAFSLYNEHWPILTHVPPQPPAKFVLDESDSGRVGRAVSSVVSNGVIVSGGLVRESVLSPGVRVDDWACVERAVVLHHARIGRRAVVRDAILDKNVTCCTTRGSGGGRWCATRSWTRTWWCVRGPPSEWTRSGIPNAGSQCPTAGSPWSARDAWSSRKLRPYHQCDGS